MLQGLGKTVTCMALVLKTLGLAAVAAAGAEVATGPDSRGRPCGYYLLRESGAWQLCRQRFAADSSSGVAYLHFWTCAADSTGHA